MNSQHSCVILDSAFRREQPYKLYQQLDYNLTFFVCHFEK